MRHGVRQDFKTSINTDCHPEIQRCCPVLT